MVKRKKKLDEEWTDRKIHFWIQKQNNKRYCIHANHFLIGDDSGKLKTVSHDYPQTEGGWPKTEKKAREYVDKGYTVTITSTGS